MRVLTFVKIVQLIPLFFVEISKEVEQKMIDLCKEYYLYAL